MMAVGTGTIIAVSSLSQVGWDTMNMFACQISNFPVIYRSKDANLPDGSGEEGPGGEVYFDVRVEMSVYFRQILMTHDHIAQFVVH
jgi:hypothetical protein